jgi:SNF2 family DNA or RNA helicase
VTLAERDGDVVVVKTEYRDRDLIRAVPGANYDVSAHVWKVPLSWAACLTLRGLFRERLDVGPALNAWAGHHKATIVGPALAMRDATEADGDPALYPFQRAGVKYLALTRRTLLQDEMGTGKTVQAIRALAEASQNGENPFPALIACPNNMKRGWEKEFATWWPGVKTVILQGGRMQRLKQIELVTSGQAHALIVNWEALRSHSRLAPYGSCKLRHCMVCDPILRDEYKVAEAAIASLKATFALIDENDVIDEAVTERERLEGLIIEAEDERKKVHRRVSQSSCERCRRELNLISWRSIIADEAHKMKNPTAKQTRALWSITTPATEFRYALTGTPIADAPQDLWGALHFIDERQWPVRGGYIDRWCQQSFNPFGSMNIIGLKPETREEFFAITDPHTRRMPKALVLPQLPPKVYTERYVEMSPKQSRAYVAMAKSMVAQIEDAGGGSRLVAVNPLTQLTRLTQFASAYAELDETNTVHLIEPSNKIDALLDILEEVGGKPLGVFAHSRQLIDLASARLNKHGIPHVLIVGGQSTDERQLSIDRFQRGEVHAVLATVQAGGVAITLTRGDTCIFLERSWSAIDNTQGEDRFHRIGSEIHKKITYVDIISEGTIEEHQRDVLEGKAERLEEIVRDKELLKRVLGI